MKALALALCLLTVSPRSTPERTARRSRRCGSESTLCRIAPFFCPGAYPRGLEPCWPQK